jgi:hypothetical protein
MREQGSKTDWKVILDENANISEMWENFKVNIDEMEGKYIPKTRFESGKSQTPLDRET